MTKTDVPIIYPSKKGYETTDWIDIPIAAMRNDEMSKIFAQGITLPIEGTYYFDWDIGIKSDYGMIATGDPVYLHMADLDDRMERVEFQVAALRSDLDSHLGTRVIEVRDLPHDKLKRIIVERVEEQGDFWPDELADEFNVSVWAVLETIDELVQEGVLEAKDRDDVPRKREHPR